MGHGISKWSAICRKKVSSTAASQASTATLDSSREKGPTHNNRVQMLRQPSEEVAGVCGVSRLIARNAINHAKGDVNNAVANLMSNAVAPPFPPFVALARSESAELMEFGGINRDLARQLLDYCNNDIQSAQHSLFDQFIAHGIEDITFDHIQSITGGGGDGRGNAEPLPLAATEQEAAAWPAQTPSEPINCAICFETVPASDGWRGGCGCSYCNGCMQQYTSMAINEGGAAADGLVKCPTDGCHGNVSQFELRALVGMEGFQRLDQQAIDVAVSIDPTLHCCPTPDCKFITSWVSEEEDGCPVLDCPLCGRQTCLLCQQAWHQGPCGRSGRSGAAAEASASFPDAEASKHAKDEAKTMAWINSAGNVRRCGRCGNAVLKASGCDKMKCRCGYRFCYQCGAENAQCGCTPSSHGFIDNVTGRGDFRDLRNKQSPA